MIHDALANVSLVAICAVLVILFLASIRDRTGRGTMEVSTQALSDALASTLHDL